MPLTIKPDIDGEPFIITLPDGREVACRLYHRHGKGQAQLRVMIEAPDDVRIYRKPLTPTD